MRIAALVLVLISANVFAAKSYISGVQKVTFRSGPGKTNKIIKMIESDAAVTVLEEGEEWTKVKGRFREITFNEPVEQLLFLASEYVAENFTTKTSKSEIEKCLIHKNKIFSSSYS